jgi:IclR family transcriptional regulator, acetate operon repressor
MKNPSVSAAPIAAAPKKKPRVQSAARAIDVLQVVARADSGGISARDLSIELDLPRQVIYHLIHTLISINMLRRAGGSTFVLGLGVANLGQGYRRQTGAPDYLTRYAEQAAAQTGETAYVVGWVDTEIVVFASARGASAIHAAELSPGTAGDAHARASGKLLLAMSTDDEVDKYLTHRPLTARTENTLTDRAAIAGELARIRQRWVATEREEYAVGLACLAVPIGTPPGRLALGISAPADRLNLNIESYTAILRKIGSAPTS